MNSQSADRMGVATAGMGTRRLQTTLTSTFKLFYSLVCAGLRKLFMQYKIQQTVFQFCKFYEYKLGGTALSMCDSTKFYMATDIEKMRAYQPPTFKAVAVTALLPTKPTAAGDDSSNGMVKPRPYLDLEKLRKDETVLFALPIKDLAWLRQFGWIFCTDTTLAGVIVQSMQIMMLFTSTSKDSSPSSSLETFDMVSTVQIASMQRLAPRTQTRTCCCRRAARLAGHQRAALLERDHKLVPPVGQVRQERRELGALHRRRRRRAHGILSSLFSIWQISMPRDGLSDVGKGYKLALPSANDTNAVDFNVVALLKVVGMIGTTAAILTISKTRRTSRRPPA